MGAVADFVGDVVGGVVDAVGDVVETVGDVVSDAVEFVGDVVQAVVDDPLPTLLAIAGQAVGIPVPVTMAAVTASRGGDIQDIVLSAGTAYFAPMATNAVSSVLAQTVGDAIVNQTVSNIVVDGVSRGLVSGTVSELRGGDFDDGFAGAFTGTVIGAGVGEVTNFVRSDIVDSLGDLGVAQDTANAIINTGRNALTAGVTAEVTGRSDFDTAFTNSLINSTATGITNFATNTISNQFESIISTNNEITGADEGNVEDQDQIMAELTDAWANRDINQINNLIGSNDLSAGDLQTMFDLTDEDMNTLSNTGVKFNDEDTGATTTILNTDTGDAVGTGAGINSTLVDEIDTGFDGTDTGDATDVVENDSTTFVTEDLSDSTSISTLSGSDTTGLSNYTDDTVEDIDLSWLDTGPSDEDVEVEDVYGPFQYEAVDTDTEPVYEEETATTAPVGGLSAVSPAAVETAPITEAEQPETTNQAVRDLLSEVTPDVSAYTESGEKTTDVAGGLNNLVDQGARAIFGTGVPSAAQIGAAATGALSSAFRQGLTKSIRGQLTRPATKTVTRRVPVKVPKKTVVPTKSGLSAVVPSKVDVKTLRPTTSTKVAPKKVDVKTLSPVSTISGISSLVGGKG